MITLENRTVLTDTDDESESLLRIAVSQGYRLPKGLKAMTDGRVFRFSRSPYKEVACPRETQSDSTVSYRELFGDADGWMGKILNDALRFCRANDIEVMSLHVNEEPDKYKATARAKTISGGSLTRSDTLDKPLVVTIEQIEEKFGCPITIKY